MGKYLGSLFALFLLVVTIKADPFLQVGKVYWLIEASKPNATGRVLAVSDKNPNWALLQFTDVQIQYDHDGNMIFSRDGKPILAAPFDPGSLHANWININGYSACWEVEEPKTPRPAPAKGN